MKVKSLSRARLLATPWTPAYQAPPSMGFSRQEYWSGLPLSSPTPQFKSFNALVLSFIVQHSHPYMTTGKTIALTRQTFVGKVMSLLFNMLSQSQKVKSLSRVQLFATPWTAASQAPPSMGLSRQEYWSGVPLPSPTASP